MSGKLARRNECYGDRGEKPASIATHIHSSFHIRRTTTSRLTERHSTHKRARTIHKIHTHTKIKNATPFAIVDVVGTWLVHALTIVCRIGFRITHFSFLAFSYS